MLDESETRRGKPCWYLTEEGEKSCIYDAVLVKETINDTLKKYFKESHIYQFLDDAIFRTSFELYIGHKMELETVIRGKNSIEFFTPDRYRIMTKYKTSPIVRLSIELGMYLAGITDVKLHSDVKNVVHNIGYLAQVQVIEIS